MPNVLIERALIDVTDWMPADATPVREGVYERLFPGGPFTCWNGRAWNADAASPQEAALETGLSAYQTVGWRGATAPAPEPCATCRGHTVIDRGVDEDSGDDAIDECPDCA